MLRFVLPMGDVKLAGIGTEDIGKCAYGIFKGGDPWIGQRVGVAGEHLSGGEMAAALTESLGETVEHADVSPDTYRSFGFRAPTTWATCSSTMPTFRRWCCLAGPWRGPVS